MNNADPPIVVRLLNHATSAAVTRVQNTAGLGRRRSDDTAHPVDHSLANSQVGFVGILPILKQFAIISSILIFLLSTSLILYALFYMMIMPGYNATAKLYFDHSGIANHPTTRILPTKIDPVCNFQDNNTSNPTCSFLPNWKKNAPWAVADLFSKHSHWEAFHDECIPNLVTERRLLKPGHSYYMEVSLDLPESNINRNSGIFGVAVELQSSNGTTLASSIRSSRMPHETSWISNIRKTILIVPILIGAIQESKVVTISSFRHFVEVSDLPLRYVTVRLIRQGEESPSNGIQLDDRQQQQQQKQLVSPAVRKPLEIITGEICMGEELSEFQLFLKEYFFLSGLLGTCFFFFFQISLLAAFYLSFEIRRRRQLELDDASENLDLQAGSYDQASDTLSDQAQDPSWDEANEVPINATTQPTNLDNTDNDDPGDDTERSRPETPSLGQENTETA